jgi:hypothetical protein
VKKSAALLLLLVVACGKRGDPTPPVPVIPKATSDLVVTQRGSNVILTWSYPSLTTAGKGLTRIRRVVVYRYVEQLPVSQPLSERSTPPDAETQPGSAAQFARVPTLAAPQFNKLKERLDSIEGANLPAASSGARLTFADVPQFHANDGRPVRLTYGVVTEGENAKSDLSNLASIVPLDVPTAPPALTATAKAEGVTLSWTAPTTSVTAGAKPVLAGYNVYRIAPGSTDELTTPINASLVTTTTYTDVPSYGEHAYRVTAVAAAGTPRIESEPSPEARVTYKDLLPPPAPTGLVALVETNAVRLVWDPVDSPDLAGYKIYRSEGAGAELKIVARVLLTQQPITATNYRDTTTGVGVSHFYEVTAVDKSGNESKPAKSDWALAPRTP